MISHHHKTVFVHVPKCGGQSIEMMFLRDLGLGWATRAPLLMRPNSIKRLGPPGLAHLTAPEYAQFRYMSDRQFALYYKFAFVRSPYNRLVSLYNFMADRPKSAASIPIGFDRFMSSWLPRQFEIGKTYDTWPHGYAGLYWFIRPQADFVFGPDDALLVDDMFRLEDIATAMPRLRARSGVKTKLKHVNKSKTDQIGVQDLTPDHIAQINTLYARDFRLLGYPTRA